MNHPAKVPTSYHRGVARPDSSRAVAADRGGMVHHLYRDLVSHIVCRTVVVHLFPGSGGSGRYRSSRGQHTRSVLFAVAAPACPSLE